MVIDVGDYPWHEMGNVMLFNFEFVRALYVYYMYDYYDEFAFNNSTIHVGHVVPIKKYEDDF